MSFAGIAGHADNEKRLSASRPAKNEKVSSVHAVLSVAQGNVWYLSKSDIRSRIFYAYVCADPAAESYEYQYGGCTLPSSKCTGGIISYYKATTAAVILV